MATRMLQRRGTAAEWAAANPVLGDGEVGVERDTGFVKVGDGVTAWTSLTNLYRRFADSVAKAGDTMTGNLTILKDNAALLLQETVTDRLQIITNTGTQYVQVDDELHITAIDDAATLKNLRAGQIYDTGSRVYSPSNPQPATNPFAVVDAVGDLLVGSANDAVARLAKGPNGSVLTVSSGGVVVWQTPVDASTKVSKTGDTMTGALIFDSGSGSDRIRITQTAGAQYMQVDDELRITAPFTDNLMPLKAGAIYDNANRVYSASNPPPASGAMINQTIRGVVFPNPTTAYPGGTAFTVTIPSVNMAKSQLRNLGSASQQNSGCSTLMWLSSATVISMHPQYSTDSWFRTSYELTEWT